MHKNIVVALRRIAIVWLALGLTGCAGMAAAPGAPAQPPGDTDIIDVIWRGEDAGWVYLVNAEPGAGLLDHPARLDADWLRELLASIELEFEQGDRDVESSVFNERQLDRLVPALVRGLARAEPDQEVVFALVGPQPGARIFEQAVVTAGRVFIADGRLNILFGEVLEPVSDSQVARGAFVPGTRAFVRLEEDREVRSLLWSAAPERQDWVSIAARQGSGRLPPMPGPSKASQNQPEAPAPAAIPELSVAPPGSSTPADSESAERSSATEIRRRLETLKGLYEDDLITEQEYARERAEILEAF